MKTSQIKNFAQSLRNQLRDGVKQRLLYWGFNEKGEVNERPEPVEGGYMFRGEVFSDETVPNRWKQLKRMVDLHGIDYVIEEGAYTWFNRLIAIRILEKNDYIQPQLQYEEGTELPHLLQNARRGIFPDMKDNELKQLKKQLRENRDNEAFARLLTHFCDTQPLISKVFGKISYSNDFTELLLPQNLLDQEGILDFIVTTEAITDEDFEQVELIGWLYQYYISEKKKEVFSAFNDNIKAGPEELPAATQFFTPEWIVRYMVENTVGRLWVDLHPDSSVQKRFEYFVEPAEENPKAEPIIEDVTDLTLLDPAAGSGHILVIGFEYLMEMYREEGYTARQAIEGILENNLYGLEIDERAAQLARFAVLLKAAKYDQAVLDGDKLPHIHSFPEQTNISTAEIREFLGSEGEPYVDEFKDALNILQEGKNFGSTIKLEISREAVAFAKKRAEALQHEAVENLAVKQLLQKIEPFIQVIDLLNKQYKTVAANPPYMTKGNHNSSLKEYLEANYQYSKNDLFSVFMEVGMNFLVDLGKLGMINQDSWMFKKTFKHLRKKVVDNYQIENLLHLGPNTFPDISGEVVQSVAFIFSKGSNNQVGKYYKLTNYGDTESKKVAFNHRKVDSNKVYQSDFLLIKGYIFSFWLSNTAFKHLREDKSLSEFYSPKQGIKTGKNPYFIKYWHEVSKQKLAYDGNVDLNTKKWFPCNKGGEYRKWYGNNYYVLNWKDDGHEIKNFTDDDGNLRSRPQNIDYFFNAGLTWSTSAGSNISFRYFEEDFTFESSGSSIFPKNGNDLFYVMGFLNSSVCSFFLDALTTGRGYSEGAIKKLPISDDFFNSDTVRQAVRQAVNLVKEYWVSKEYTWEFKTNGLINDNSGNLEDAVRKRSTYLSEKIQSLKLIEEEINEEFIEIYKLNESLSHQVFENEITSPFEEIVSKGKENSDGALQASIDEEYLIKEFISYIIGCYFGRFRLDKPGIYIAQKEFNKRKLDPYSVNVPFLGRGNSEATVRIDDDGLIPLIGSDGPFSDDIVYLAKDFIKTMWGEDSISANLNYINRKLGSLEKFLTKKFWDYHSKMYSRRPIYWLFSSKNGAFKVLAYMHRMDKYAVQKVRQNYLHPYMDYLRIEIDKLEGRDSLSSDESKQLDTYRSNLNECLEYDEVIKEVADKQIDFDLDDGVKHNYELFGNALAKI